MWLVFFKPQLQAVQLAACVSPKLSERTTESREHEGPERDIFRHCEKQECAISSMGAESREYIGLTNHISAWC